MFDLVRDSACKVGQVPFGVNDTFHPGQSYNYPEGTISNISVLIEKKKKVKNVHEPCPYAFVCLLETPWSQPFCLLMLSD